MWSRRILGVMTRAGRYAFRPTWPDSTMVGGPCLRPVGRTARGACGASEPDGGAAGVCVLPTVFDRDTAEGAAEESRCKIWLICLRSGLGLCCPRRDGQGGIAINSIIQAGRSRAAAAGWLDAALRPSLKNYPAYAWRFCTGSWPNSLLAGRPGWVAGGAPVVPAHGSGLCGAGVSLRYRLPRHPCLVGRRAKPFWLDLRISKEDTVRKNTAGKSPRLLRWGGAGTPSRASSLLRVWAMENKSKL